MVIFDQLRISDDGKELFINAHVNKASIYDNVKITSITIMSADKVSENDPMCAPDREEDWLYHKNYDEGVREINIVLPTMDSLNWGGKADLSKDLFFVYIDTNGAINSECAGYLPCDLQKKTTLGVTFDENLLYQRAMNYTKELSSTCNITQGFTDFILLWNAFKASIETEHYIPAIKFYNMLFGNATDSDKTDGSHSPYGAVVGSTIKPCGCNG